MLQITSINKETAIAPELVQNGNFSEISTTNLVTNPNFTDTGDELAVALTSFTSYTVGSSTVTYDGSIAELNIDALDSLAVIYTPTTIFEYGKSYKIIVSMKGSAALTASVAANTNHLERAIIAEPVLTTDYQTFTYYFTQTEVNFDYNFAIKRLNGGGGASQTIFIESASVQELGEGWSIQKPTGQSVDFNGTQVHIDYDAAATQGSTGINQSPLIEGKSYKIVLDIATLTGDVGSKLRVQAGGVLTDFSDSGVKTFYVTTTDSGPLYIVRAANGTSFVTYINSISVQQLDPNEDWILSNSDLSIGENKGIFNNATLGQDFNQQKFTIDENVSYRATFDLLNYESGSLSWKTTGGSSPIGASYDANGTGLTFDFIGDVEGGTPGVRLLAAAVSNNTFAVTNISVKKLATYLDQSIYVTAADVQTIAQNLVFYLVELTSMSSQNSLYFIPTSITANNGRYTKMNFTVISKDGITDPADGIISFYDADGGEDTYPMGFYKFKIYEQTSPTNLDPTLATKLLEEGTVFVQNISGNTSEITSAFNEYDPTLTQYVYSQ